MRHHNSNRKFGRKKNVREALLKSLVLNLVIREKIKTTLPKAKELRPFIEKIITKAKKDTLASRRIVLSSLFNRAPETKKLFTKIGPRFKDRNGGYTRILKLGVRKSDGAEMAQIELLQE
ncbi:MAG: 50S ribosomal protein L17 [Candidatus Pacebacteria bacterium]|nr:50S ribosomal protein L17 [Candidatus Paceibacterota bacterium]MCF7862915.1 50S ribosomal protein L17 [Candidatus Paceibacterota bacterium]